MDEYTLILITVVLSVIVFGMTVEYILRVTKRKDNHDNNFALINSLKSMPQSGFWIRCKKHGDVPLTTEAYDVFTASSKYRCPICDDIPIKIWRKS